ncbi:3-dehydro-L-gulonate 2-dehydrogenase [Proteiniclasticum sp. SCR006]|uniref:3-dehydro-L-gulonate 2-dehydrogenase n=1 Tax=Proteiniclasticum aestuarii TaxID=2817862 RepID=A0A939HBR1_9CLOT|nr:3-dehydro-L-gulonate 2-dehydrogenase [Proteiniclasticum aestuarii]MBO1265435.1 3-dehydro-L-gulonate 2-dehydrogenase [Proteiniclasticum aestuarii]
MRIPYETMLNEFKRILTDRGVSEDIALEAAMNFAKTSLDGVYSHGVNRFPRIVGYIDRGIIDPKALPECEMRFGAMERWNGNLGLGNINAKRAMNRACELAEENGIGIVALRNTNHWLRGGAYGWQAAEEGYIGICWTNTMPNMPAYGGKDHKIGNNPFIMAVPRTSGEHVVLDMAMSQFSYGKLEDYRMKGKKLPIPGGYDKEGKLSTDPGAIEESGRVLPIGFWKGSGLSIVLDMIATVLAGGNATCDIEKDSENESGLSQVLLAIDPKKFSTAAQIDEMITRIVEDLKTSEMDEEIGGVSYPGQSTIRRRKENLEKGIPVQEEVWNRILAL